jgi:hypothetical protein
MRIVAALTFLAAMASGCSILGYRELSDLKSEAKYRVSQEVGRDPVIVYRDVVRALNACTKDPVAGPYRQVISNLNRKNDSGEVSLKHDGRFVALYEIEKISDQSAHVSGWWLTGVSLCQPRF